MQSRNARFICITYLEKSVTKQRIKFRILKLMTADWHNMETCQHARIIADKHQLMDNLDLCCIVIVDAPTLWWHMLAVEQQTLVCA